MRYKILSALAAVTLAGAACSNITDINQNPNGPVAVQPPSILPSVEQSILTSYTFSDGFNVRYGGLWAQHFSEIQYPDEDRYIVRSGTTGGWGMYTGAAEDAQRMIDAGIAASTPNWEAVGRIMKAYAFSIMTDAMGDLPYTDALKGDSMLQPTYDTQQAIYDSLFAQLTTAVGEIDASAGAVGFSSGDLIYGGDMAEWKKLANSLRLRLALHIVNVDPVKAQSEAEAAVAAGVFTSNDDNAGLSYLTSAPNQNPIYVNHLSRDDYGMSATLVDSMLSLNDPRLPFYARPNDSTGTYNGRPNGLLSTSPLAPPNKLVSRIGDYWRTTPNATMYFMTYAEVLLLEAEGANRGWNMGGATAATLYQDAIAASMDQWGISAGATNTYLGQSQVAYAGGAAGLTQIQYQLWIQLYMNGEEAWTEWRRTRVPSLAAGPDAVSTTVPERMPYDDQELVLNNANVTAAVSRQGLAASNDLFTPLWFTGRAP